MDKDPRIGKCELNAPVTRDDFVQTLARLGMDICEKVESGDASCDEMQLLVALAAGYAEQLARKLRSIEQDGIAECDVYEAIELARTLLPLLEAIY